MKSDSNRLNPGLSGYKFNGVGISGSGINGHEINGFDTEGQELNGAEVNEPEVRRSELNMPDIRERDLNRSYAERREVYGAEVNEPEVNESGVRGSERQGTGGKQKPAGFREKFTGIQERFVGMKSKIAAAGSNAENREDERSEGERREDGDRGEGKIGGKIGGGKKGKREKGEGKKFRITKKQGAGMAVLAAAGIAVLLYFLRPQPQEEVYPTVVAEPVVLRDVEIYGEYVGRIRAQQFVEIRARVEGYLEKMLFEEGTYIRKNQTLFIIDPRMYRAKTDRARAQLQKNKALELKAKRDLERIRPLYEQNAASQLDLDNAIASYESAAAEVEMSQADLTQAEMELGYTTVRSPISGYISERNVDIGTLVGPGGKSLLATVVKSDTVRVDFSMTGLDYLRSKERNVNLGHRDASRKWDPYITVTLPDNTVYPFRGLVDFADPQVDPQTGTFSVRAEMANPDHILLPGQFTKVKLLLDIREGAVAVPNKAIIIEKGGAYIFVVRPDSIVEKRFIELGPEVGNSTVVERGLAQDEKIIVEGYHKLAHGMRVNVVAPVEDPARQAGDDGEPGKDRGERTNEKLYPADSMSVPENLPSAEKTGASSGKDLTAKEK